MLNSIIFALTMMVSPAAPSVGPSVKACETYAPNLEGIRVTVCGGEVVSRCDSFGSCTFAASTYSDSSEVR